MANNAKTEPAARTSVCFRAQGFLASREVNTHPHCIGSLCMAWRWSEAKRTGAFLAAVRAHMNTQPKPNFNTALQAVFAAEGDRFEHTEGYCGAAGPA